MAEIDINSDLKAVTEKVEALVANLQQLDAQRQEIVQQIQNLNGVAMYLRGKTDDSPTEATTDSEVDNKET